MKVRISFTVDVNPEAWANEYGIEPSEVRKDVQSYLSNAAWTHLRDNGLLLD